MAEGLLDVLEGWLAGADVRYGDGCGCRSGARCGAGPVIVVATGAEEFPPADRRRRDGGGRTPGTCWPARHRRRVLVADWGGDWTGLDVAETLAERGV